MGQTTNQTTGQNVPDTATTYERAKPEAESPSKSLDQKPAGAGGVSKETLHKDANPDQQKESKPSK